MNMDNLQTVYLLKLTDENGFESVIVTTNKETIPSLVCVFLYDDDILDDVKDDPTDAMVQYANELNIGESGYSLHWWGVMELFVLQEHRIMEIK